MTEVFEHIGTNNGRDDIINDEAGDILNAILAMRSRLCTSQ